MLQRSSIFIFFFIQFLFPSMITYTSDLFLLFSKYMLTRLTMCTLFLLHVFSFSRKVFACSKEIPLVLKSRGIYLVQASMSSPEVKRYLLKTSKYLLT